LDGDTVVQDGSSVQPAVSPHLTIGFNSTMRRLEEHIDKVTIAVGSESLAVMFICRSAVPEPILHSIPMLVAAASGATPMKEPIRLVDISSENEAAIALALGVPRISVLGMGENTTEAAALIQLVRDCIEPVDAPWLKTMARPSYLALKVNVSQTQQGRKKAKQKPKDPSG
jgi:ribonuclease P/MRP protein subunit POP3